ncbi:hypothetical protein OYC64_012794 [Pagothenia borchgrevinki]|uniref:CxC3 like cysteine cluster domain-containing protein n=1 Tax=Pagothenia borchgrevinki TaxID=8213 RepID=A0ABD2FS81_PAGBO
MAGRQAPRRTSLNWDESDSDEDKEEIDQMKAKLGEKLQAKEDCQPAVKWRERDQFGRLIVKTRSSSKVLAKRQKKTGQSQLPNISAEHVADSTEGTFTSEVQQTHNMIDLHIQELHKLQLRRMLPDVQIPQKPHLVEHGQYVRLYLMKDGGKQDLSFLKPCLRQERSRRVFVNCAKLKMQSFVAQTAFPKCDITVHRKYSLHNRCLFVGDSYKAIPPTDIITEDARGQPSPCEEVRLLPFSLPRKTCSCNADNVSLSGGQKVIFININGRYDLSVPLLTCENCHCQWTPQIKDLISNGYWPGTIEFHTVFSIDLFATLSQTS